MSKGPYWRSPLNDRPQSLRVGIPHSAKLYARGNWPEDEVDWVLILNFDGLYRLDSIELRHLNDGWQTLAMIHDCEGAVAREMVGGISPKGFAERLLVRLQHRSATALPNHVFEYFHRAVTEWVTEQVTINEFARQSNTSRPTE